MSVIAFSCACGASLNVPDSMARSEGRCPTCSALLAVPAREDVATGDWAEPPSEPTIRFRCPACRKTLRSPLRLAGKSARCASCAATFTAPVPPPQPPVEDEPSLRAAFSIVKLRCVCGVTSSRPRGAELGDCPACGRALPADGD